VSFNLAIRFLVVFLLFAALLPAQSGAPTLGSGGVTNAADYSRTLAPGSIMTLWGTNMAAKTAYGSKIPLPTTLEGTSVEVIDGQLLQQAPLFYISSGQINAQLPFGLKGPQIKVRVRTAAGVSTSETVTLQARAPRLFSKTQDGKGEAVVLHADWSVVSAQSPARSGEVLILFLNSLGEVQPELGAGQGGGDGSEAAPLNLLPSGASVTVGGKPAPVLFAGIAPYFVGLFQINFRMPSNSLGGLEPLVVAMEGSESQASIAVAAATEWQSGGSGPVGANGGTVTAGGLSVTIPSGVFSSTTTLGVYRKPSGLGAALDGSRISDVFALDGLPQSFSGNVSISLAATGTPAVDDVIFVAFRDTGGASGTTFLKATIQNGRITATLPAASATSAGVAPLALAEPPRRQAVGKATWMYWALKGFRGPATSNSGRFVVFYMKDAVTLDRARQIAQYLDDAYALLANMGLDWTLRTKPNWPIETFVYPFTGDDVEKSGEEGSLLSGKQSQGLNFNSSFTATDEQMKIVRVTAGHELLHLLQNLYDPRAAGQMASGGSSWLWMEEATATWFESAISGDPTYLPPTASNDNSTFLVNHGLEYPPGATKDVQSHGYGASLFLQAVVPASAFLQLHQQMAVPGSGTFLSSKYSPVDALATVLGDVPGAWRKFCRQYLTGKIYGKLFPDPDTIRGLAGYGTKIMLSGELQLQPVVTKVWKAPDLSAAFYTVHLSSTYAWKSGTKLVLTMDDPGGQAEMIIYRYGSTTYELVGAFRDQYTLDGAESLPKNKLALLVMIANGRAVAPYNGTTSISFRAEVDINLLDIIKRSTKITAQWSGTVLSGSLAGRSYSSLPGGHLFNDRSRSVPLTWSGAAFKGCITYPEYAETMTVCFDGALTNTAKSLVSLKATMKGVNSFDGSTSKNIVMEFRDLPLNAVRWVYQQEVKYELAGAQCASYATLLTYFMRDVIDTLDTVRWVPDSAIVTVGFSQ